jgi:zinc transporter ZupT
MKKLFTILAVMALFSLSAQAQVYKKGDKLLNAGLGLGSNFGGGIPIGASFEYGIHEDISVGGYLGYGYYSYRWWGTTVSVSNFLLGARGSYHLGKFIDLGPQFDPYAGLLLGYNIASASIKSNDPNINRAFGSVSSGGLLFGAHIGLRYYHKENLGGFAELGYGISFLTVGVALKL